MADSERNLALFIDFENLALGFQGRRERFDIQRVLKRMVEKGKIVAKKAYADWNRFASYTESLHEAAIELIEIPRRAQTGKNSADIRLCVDAMDLAYSKEHIDSFVVVSGDSDFSPLVSKLKENGKRVIGLGMTNSTSELLRDNCDEFIYYEDLEEQVAEIPTLDQSLPETKRKAFALLIDSLLALRRENKEVLHSSMIKDTMKRKKPSFNETYHGYRTFTALLEDAYELKLIELETDPKSGTYVVTRFGDELKGEPTAVLEEARERRRSRRGGRRRRGPGRTTAPRPEIADRPPAAEKEPAPVEPVPDSPPVVGTDATPAESRPRRRPARPTAPEPEAPPAEPPPPPPAAVRAVDRKSDGFGAGILDR